MAKEKNYTNNEIVLIQELLKSLNSIDEISNKTWRSTSWIKNLIVKKNLKVYCKKCWIEKEKWQKKYCKKCSTKIKKDFWNNWYHKNKIWYKEYRYNKYRFWWNYNKALIRDWYKCVECWMTNEEHNNKYKCNLTVDHIDWKWRNTKEKNNNINNLQTLCLSCHWKKDTKKTIHYRKKYNL